MIQRLECQPRRGMCQGWGGTLGTRRTRWCRSQVAEGRRERYKRQGNDVLTAYHWAGGWSWSRRTPARGRPATAACSDGRGEVSDKALHDDERIEGRAGLSFEMPGQARARLGTGERQSPGAKRADRSPICTRGSAETRADVDATRVLSREPQVVAVGIVTRNDHRNDGYFLLKRQQVTETTSGPTGTRKIATALVGGGHGLVLRDKTTTTSRRGTLKTRGQGSASATRKARQRETSNRRMEYLRAM